MKNINKQVAKFNENEGAIYKNRLKIGVGYETNPFIFDNNKTLVLNIEKGYKKVVIGKGTDILINEYGEVTGATMIYKAHEIDKEKFVKVFTDNMHLLFELTKPSMKVLSYIMSNVPVNKDELFIHIPDMMKSCNWRSTNQCYTGLRELCVKKLIAQSVKQGFYYINPTIFFNGNRMTMVNDYFISKQYDLEFNEEANF